VNAPESGRDDAHAALYRSVVECAPDAVVVVDTDGRIILANERAQALFGYASDELLGQRIELLVPEKLRWGHVRDRVDYMAAERPLHRGFTDLISRRKDGTEFRADISLSAVETEGRRVAIAFVRDNTKRWEADFAVRHLAAIVDSSDDAIIGKALDGTIVSWNRGAEQMYGYSEAEMIGQPISVLRPAESHDDLPEIVARLQSGEEIEPIETTRRRRDGAEIDVILKISAIRDATGEMIGTSTITRDVTQLKAEGDLARDVHERRTLLAHLVAAEEEDRARIAGDIHDDSIQAITAAGMRLQMLRRQLDDPAHLALLAELEQSIRLAVERLRHLLFDLRPPVLDNEGLSAALDMYLVDAAKGSDTRYRIEDRLTSQPSPETRTILYRIVQEALVNVRKHAGARSVTVLLEERDDGYFVQIADDGSGFAVDETKPVLGHLGLAAIRERALLAGGRMEIRSSPRGTVMDVWVPATEPANTFGVAGATARDAAAETGER
jgi:PAS domain S-box-containing protein